MSQALRQKISNKVKNLRISQKLTRETLSLQLGLDNSYISKLERCKINISVEQLEKIANYFDVSIKDFFE